MYCNVYATNKSLVKNMVPCNDVYAINQGKTAAGLTYHKNQNQMSYVPSSINPFFRSTEHRKSDFFSLLSLKMINNKLKTSTFDALILRIPNVVSAQKKVIFEDIIGRDGLCK